MYLADQQGIHTHVAFLNALQSTLPFPGIWIFHYLLRCACPIGFHLYHVIVVCSVTLLTEYHGGNKIREVTSQQGNGGKTVSEGKIVGTISQGSHDAQPSINTKATYI